MATVNDGSCIFTSQEPTLGPTLGPSTETPGPMLGPAHAPTLTPTQTQCCTYAAAAELLFGPRGCTYATAPNYDSEATFDDGSCEFAPPLRADVDFSVTTKAPTPHHHYRHHRTKQSTRGRATSSSR